MLYVRSTGCFMVEFECDPWMARLVLKSDDYMYLYILVLV